MLMENIETENIAQEKKKKTYQDLKDIIKRYHNKNRMKYKCELCDMTFICQKGYETHLVTKKHKGISKYVQENIVFKK